MQEARRKRGLTSHAVPLQAIARDVRAALVDQSFLASLGQTDLAFAASQADLDAYMTDYSPPPPSDARTAPHKPAPHLSELDQRSSVREGKAATGRMAVRAERASPSQPPPGPKSPGSKQQPKEQPKEQPKAVARAKPKRFDLAHDLPSNEPEILRQSSSRWRAWARAKVVAASNEHIFEQVRRKFYLRGYYQAPMNIVNPFEGSSPAP